MNSDARISWQAQNFANLEVCAGFVTGEPESADFAADAALRTFPGRGSTYKT